MTTDYEAYAGDTLNITLTVLDESSTPLDVSGAAMIYVVRNRNNAEVLRKTTADGTIAVSGNVATVLIAAGDTAALDGQAYHELRATDGSGNVSTLLAGWVRFRHTEIEP